MLQMWPVVTLRQERELKIRLTVIRELYKPHPSGPDGWGHFLGKAGKYF